MATIQLTTADFKEKIFDYDSDQDWHHKGALPVIVDFYADWCGPCKMVAPILEELSEVYQGQVDFYKVDTEKELELSSVFGIQSIPTFLFIPLGDATPMIESGALPKHVFMEIIDEQLLKPNQDK